MNAYMNKNSGKLLVAVLAMTMIIAGAAVVLSDNEVSATEQNQSDFLAAVSNGTYELTENKEVTITTPLTSTDLANGLTVTGAFTLTLSFEASANYQSMITGVNITVGEGATVKVVMTGSTDELTNTHIFQDLDITIKNGGSLVISQSSEGQSWYNASEQNLTMEGNATMVFDAANGISNVKAILGGTSAVSVKNAQFANLTFTSLQMEKGTSVKILDGDSSKTNMNIGADSTIAGTVDANNSNIYFTSGITITNTGGSISANQMKVLKPSGDTTPTLTINGGSVSGEFIPATDGTGEGASTIATTVTLNGVSVNNVTYADGVSLGEGSTVTMSGNLGIGDTINADLTVEDLAYLTDDLTIPEGKTLTISGYGTLDMLNHNITIEGTLVIERNGVVTSSVTGGENGIVLTRTGTIQNNGILGDTNTVTITGEGAADQKVSMKGVSGLSVNLARNGSNYYLAVSGDVSRISGMDAEIALYKVTVTDAMTIGKNVNFTATDVTIGNNVTFTNNGTATVQASFTLENGASIVVVGSTPAKITAETGKIQKDGSIDGETEITLNNNVKGVTVSVGRVTVPTATESYLDQRMYITGSTDRIADPDKDASDAYTTNGTITVGSGNTVYVTGTLVVPEEIAVSGIFDVTGGTIQSEVEQETNFTYIGAMYQVQTTVEGVTDDVWYYTSFANAMAAIGTAYNNEITISGEYTIDQNYTLEADQSILIVKDKSFVTVGENATITINADASVDSAAFIAIEGRVVVNDGGSYRPATYQGEIIYEVMSSNKETGVTIYSGFKVTLDAAVSGDVIDVVKSATYKGNMTVIGGVTVNVADGATLTVTGNVTVEQNGALNLGSASTLQVGTAGKNNTINVAGTIDASEEGHIVFAPAVTAAPEAGVEAADAANVDMYSTGTVVVSNAANVTVDINSAYYEDNAETVYTSVANAAAYAATNALETINATGTFSESGDITLDGVDLVLTGVEKDVVSLGNITLDEANILIDDTNNKIKYTATVTALSGEGDAAVESTVSVTETSAEIATGITMNASAENVYGFTISAISGDVKVIAGTVEFIGTDGITIDADNTLEVASGATLAITEDAELKITPSNITGVDYNDNLVNNGTILVQADVTIESDMILGGDVTINDGGSIAVGTQEIEADSNKKTVAVILTIAGTLTVSAEENNEGALNLNGGALVVGEAPSMLGGTANGAVVGQITMTTSTIDPYVEVIFGGSIADATFYNNGAVAEPNSTVYTVNGVEFATMYTFAKNMNSDAVNAQIGVLENLDEDARADITWYSGETKVGASPVVGNYAEVSTEIEYAGILFTISEGPGISIYIDDVDVDNLIIASGADRGKVALTIGQHTITVYVNAGYEGTPSVTLNGTAISGTFEVTTDMFDGDNVIFATGASPIDYNQGGSSTGGSDDGMGLTDYLLIILVVLIVIMAIMVAMRLMRS